MNNAQSLPPLRKTGAGIACAALGAGSAMSFVVSAEGYAGMSDAPASSTSYLFTALAICFAMLFWQAFARRARRPGAAAVCFGLLFGVINTLGSMLFAYDSWAMLANAGTLALTALRCAGQSAPMVAGFAWLDEALARHGSALCESAGASRAPASPSRARWARRHPTLSSMLVLLLCWLPYLVCFYPGTVCWDLGEMVGQFFGVRAMDTWHPVFLTWLLGGCVWVGRLLHSDNLGAALFTLLQTAALAYALSRTIGFMQRRGASLGARLATLGFFALTPIWGGYAQFISTDTLYTAALLLFALGGAEALCCQRRGAGAPSAVLWELFGWGLLSCLCRNNGIYVVAPTAVALVLFGGRGRARLWLSAALAGAVCAALAFSNALIPALGIRDETASGPYAVCFQQSARTLRDHAGEITAEEYAEIDRVLDGERLAELYEPWIADPVKFTFRFYGQGAAAEKEALARYMRTWRAMLVKYPLTYAEAFFAGSVSYYAFTPKLEGATYNNQAGNRLVFETVDVGWEPEYLHTRQPEALRGARTLLAAFARGWRHIPLLSLLYACPAYTWLVAGAGLSLAKRRGLRGLIAFLPALLTLGVCMLGPVNDYFRYFLPIVAMTPMLLAVAASD